MKATIFEKIIINLILGSVQHAPISELELILQLRKKFKPTDSELKMDEVGDPEIHKKIVNIKLTDQEKVLIYSKLSGPDVGLPVREETLKLLSKLKPKE